MNKRHYIKIQNITNGKIIEGNPAKVCRMANIRLKDIERFRKCKGWRLLESRIKIW